MLMARVVCVRAGIRLGGEGKAIRSRVIINDDAVVILNSPHLGYWTLSHPD